MPQQQHRNGESSGDEFEAINDSLDIQGKIVGSSDSNPLLKQTNLGLGKYDEDYKWQQIRSYRKGLYAWVAFGRALSERKVYETKMKLGEEGYNAYYDDVDDDVKQWKPFDEAVSVDLEDEDERPDRDVSSDTGWSWNPSKVSRWTAIRARGEYIWKRLGDPKQILTDEQFSAVATKTGVVDEWQPLFWEIVAGRHEMSRSDGAELLRDALTGVREYRDGVEEEESIL